MAHLDTRLSRCSATGGRVGDELFAGHCPGARTPGDGYERGAAQTLCRVAPTLGATASQESRCRDRRVAEETDQRVDVLRAEQKAEPRRESDSVCRGGATRLLRFLRFTRHRDLNGVTRELPSRTPLRRGGVNLAQWDG